ncbi:MAG TPA: copper-containing nitrite reductase [Anaerolineae bacterium]|nr:copper-containing nitrite reductase [Anaerolineae bacterium]
MNQLFISRTDWRGMLAVVVAAVLLLAACGPVEPGLDTTPGAEAGVTDRGTEAGIAQETAVVPTPAPAGEQEGTRQAGEPAVAGQQDNPASYTSDVQFTLRSTLAEGKMAFVGVGGEIDGVVNPTLRVAPDDVVQVTLVNGDGVQHDVAFPDFGAQSEMVMDEGASSTIVFRANQAGEFFYFCTVPGHRQAGMEGLLVVGEETEAEEVTAATISHDPADLPAPIGDRGPETLRIDLETVELEGRLASGTTYTYWTFNGTVPGPFLRVRVGDTVELYLKNAEDSRMIHSIDLHAVNGPGGGAELTQVAPGEEKAFRFQALNPGLYVYHCAKPMVAHHIANGMYGLILVEPEGGLPPVDAEFYVMQGEIYTEAAFGKRGVQEFSVEKLLDEQPEYMVFNGAVGALTEETPMQVQVGDTVRIYFGVGGPNLTSSFHLIGEIFDRVYNQASLTAAPLTDVQTTLVPAGGSTVVEFTVEVPGRYILVDHSLSRLERGLVGFLYAEGDENPDVFGPVE